jgi:hypothetical protein
MEQIVKDLITLTNFSDQDVQLLQQHAPKLQSWGEELVKEFYDTLYGYESTGKVFREGERAAREKTLRDWYLHITNINHVDAQFWQQQWIVGLVHITRGVTNPFMFGMTSRVQQFILRKCAEEFEPAQALQIYSAFKRLTDVIAGLIAESYFSSYVEAMEKVGGFKLALIKRMIDLEINTKLKDSRK